MSLERKVKGKVKSKVIYLMSITRGMLWQSPEPEARDKVVDNNPSRNWNFETLAF